MYAHSTPDSNVEKQYSISIFHINKIYRYILYSLSKMSYVVFLNFDCLGVKHLNLPVPANNQTDTVQISINSATALLLLWHTVLCGLISTAPFLSEKKIAQCKYEVSWACKCLVFQCNISICSLVTEICYLTFEHYHCTLSVFLCLYNFLVSSFTFVKHLE